MIILCRSEKTILVVMFKIFVASVMSLKYAPQINLTVHVAVVRDIIKLVKIILLDAQEV